MLRIHLCLLGCLASHTTSPPVSQSHGETMTGEERRGRELYKNTVLFLFRQWHIEEGCNKASWGAEGERRREMRKRRKWGCVCMCVWWGWGVWGAVGKLPQHYGEKGKQSFSPPGSYSLAASADRLQASFLRRRAIINSKVTLFTFLDSRPDEERWSWQAEGFVCVYSLMLLKVTDRYKSGINLLI